MLMTIAPRHSASPKEAHPLPLQMLGPKALPHEEPTASSPKLGFASSTPSASSHQQQQHNKNGSSSNNNNNGDKDKKKKLDANEKARETKQGTDGEISQKNAASISASSSSPPVEEGKGEVADERKAKKQQRHTEEEKGDEDEVEDEEEAEEDLPHDMKEEEEAGSLKRTSAPHARSENGKAEEKPGPDESDNGTRTIYLFIYLSTF